MTASMPGSLRSSSPSLSQLILSIVDIINGRRIPGKVHRWRSNCGGGGGQEEEEEIDLEEEETTTASMPGSLWSDDEFEGPPIIDDDPSELGGISIVRIERTSAQELEEVVNYALVSADHLVWTRLVLHRIAQVTFQK